MWGIQACLPANELAMDIDGLADNLATLAALQLYTLLQSLMTPWLMAAAEFVDFMALKSPSHTSRLWYISYVNDLNCL